MKIYLAGLFRLQKYIFEMDGQLPGNLNNIRMQASELPSLFAISQNVCYGLWSIFRS